MIPDIIDIANRSTYDFRATANPDDPLRHLFPEWVPYYRLKWAIAAYFKPARICEVGVRFGYSAQAFLDASPASHYVGLDNDSETFGGSEGALQWAREALAGKSAELYAMDTQAIETLPGGPFDLIHVDGQQDGSGTIHDLEMAMRQARLILVDGYFWTRTNFLSISEFLLRNRDLIEHYAVIPGYAGELMIWPRRESHFSNDVQSSAEIREAYTEAYYLGDCGGYQAFNRGNGDWLEDGRLRAVAELAMLWPAGRALDVGCGRGEVAMALADYGFDVTAVDYSEDAIRIASAAAAKRREKLPVEFVCSDVNAVPLDGEYRVAVASDLIEHMKPAELDCLYERISQHLSADGAFIVHTFPNLWLYRYEHARRLRIARSVDAYLPEDPRTRFEKLMHINEQSPRVLRRQLKRYFPHVCLWFSNHDVRAPFENLARPFSIAEMRAAGDLFAIASHQPIDAAWVARQLGMTALEVEEAAMVGLRILECPSTVTAGAEFGASIQLTNDSGRWLRNGAPNPIHPSYHWLDTEGREMRVFDGRRTALRAPMPPRSNSRCEVTVDAPRGAGTYLLRMTLVQEGIRWFDGNPVNVYDDRVVEVKS